MKPNSSFAQSKRRWVIRCKRVAVAVDKLSEQHELGKRVRMPDIYELAHSVEKAGLRGLDLRRKMPGYKFKRIEPVQKDLAAWCMLMADCSATLLHIAETQGLISKTMPQFTSDLIVTATINANTLPSLTALIEEAHDARNAPEASAEPDNPV